MELFNHLLTFNALRDDKYISLVYTDGQISHEGNMDIYIHILCQECHVFILLPDY